MLRGHSVRGGARLEYRRLQGGFLARWAGPLPSSEGAGDQALVRHLKDMFLEGKSLSEGRKMVAALQWALSAVLMSLRPIYQPQL